MREPQPSTITAAAQGDGQAFAELVHLLQEPVHRFLARLLNDADLAEDIAQETFVRVHRGLPSFGGRSLFSTWVFGIAHNAGVDAIRHSRRRPQTHGTVPETMIDPRQVGPSTEISQALETLSSAHREALLLVEVLGLTYREVGEILGVAEGTVKSRVHHARRLLHEWMAHGESANEV